jgi:hypothetical protein
MHGEIRLNQWMPFTARQIFTPDGFIWAADAGRFPMRIRGFDRYTNGTGEMRWKLAGLVPVMTAEGPDTTRSAAGRHAIEVAGLVPGAALDRRIAWSELDGNRVVAELGDEPWNHRITLDIDDDGSLRSASLPRWGNPDKSAHAEHPFGVAFSGERTADGYTVPAELRAGWWFGTERWDEGEFFRATIDDIEFF